MPTTTTTRALALLILLLITTATPAFAQLCTGQPSFAHYHWQTSLGLPFTKDGVFSGLTSSLGTGREPLFAIGQVRLLRAPSGGSGIFSLGLNVGSEIPVSRTLGLYACPMVTAIQTWGPDQVRFTANGGRQTIVNVSTQSLDAGVRIGVIVSESASRQIGPTFGIHTRQARTSSKPITGGEFKTTERYGIADAGLMVVLGDQMAFTPTISVPFKSDTAQIEFLLLMTFALGR